MVRFVIVKKNTRRVLEIVRWGFSDDLEEVRKETRFSEYDADDFEWILEDDLEVNLSDLKFGDIIASDGSVDKDLKESKLYVFEENVSLKNKDIPVQEKKVRVDESLEEDEIEKLEDKFGKLISEKTVSVPSDEKNRR